MILLLKSKLIEKDANVWNYSRCIVEIYYINAWFIFIKVVDVLPMDT